MTTIVCEGCGVEVEARRSTKRFCSASCRSGARRKPATESTAEESELVRVVRRELEQADRLSTVDGQLALVLAERMGIEKTAGIIGLATELRAAMARATADTSGEDDVTAARRKREEKRRAAGLEPNP